MALRLQTKIRVIPARSLMGTTDRWNLIREADLTATVLNGRQYEIGQCIVLPKRHAPTIFELTDTELAAVMESAREVTAYCFAPKTDPGFASNVDPSNGKQGHVIFNIRRVNYSTQNTTRSGSIEHVNQQ